MRFVLLLLLLATMLVMPTQGQEATILTESTRRVTAGWNQQKLIWWRTQFAEIYRAHSRQRPPMAYDDDAYDLLERQAQRAAGLSNEPYSDQERRARSLRNRSCTDPVITYILGLSLFNLKKYQEALPLLVEASEGTIAVNDPAVRSFVVAERAFSCLQRLPPARRDVKLSERLFKEFIAQARRFLDSPEVTSPFASEVVYSGVLPWLRKRNGLSEDQIVHLQSQILNYGADEWTRLMITGKFAIDQAWEAIGGNRENLTDENRPVHRAFLDQASIALAKAWEVDPRRPRAPTLMLTVVLQNNQPAGAWFERAIEFYPDFLPAYLGYQRLLFARGDRQGLMALGREAAATKNYATGVPLQLLSSILCVDAHLQTMEQPNKPFWDTPGLWDEVEAVINGYLSSPVSAYSPGYLRACQAIIAWRAGRFEQAQQALDLGGDDLSEEPFRQWLGESMSKTVRAIRDHQPPPKPVEFNDF